MSLLDFQKNDYSLVLSGGGALGFAHIGVIKDLENNSLFPPAEIIGTSMGGIVAACVSIGLKSKDIYELFKEFHSFYKWIKVSFYGNSLINSEKLEKIFSNIFGNMKIKETDIPLKIIATSLKSGTTNVLNQNIKIKDALLATMAIPGIFQEQIINNEVYVDGFLAENLPILRAKYQYIIAVDVLGENSFTKELPNKKIKTSNILEMFEKSMRFLIYNQTKCNLSNIDKNIYLIQPETKNYKTYSFHKIDEIIELGKLEKGKFI